MSTAKAGIADAFEVAWEHIDKAAKERETLKQCWNALLEAEGFESHLIIEDDHNGRLDVSVDWPESSLGLADDAAAAFSGHVRDALDCALLGAADRVSGVVQTPDKDAHRMPLCSSPPELETMLQGGSLRGLRPDQVRMVEHFQPYETMTDGAGENSLRPFMRHLAEMTASSRAADRRRVAVWAHSASPQIEIDSPGKLITCDSTGDGILERARTVARFSFVNADPDQIRGNPDIAFDFIFNDAPLPSDPDDNLEGRSKMLLAIAREFVQGMERSVGLRPPLKPRPRFSSMTFNVAGSPWGPLEPTASRPEDAVTAALTASDLGMAVHCDVDGNMTVLLRHESGVYGRRIPPARPLDSSLLQGPAAETATLAAASVWGLPDFVMRPQVIKKGTGIREVGDGTVITGRRGLVVQVKSRVLPTNNADKEVNWVYKKVAEGTRQARGTVRTLRATPFDLVSQRGRIVRCNGADIDWVGVVVVDHVSPPEVLSTWPSKQGIPIVVLLRRDWDFLFDQLRSVSAVVDYLHRVSDQESVALGNESLRYYELAQADEDAASRPPAKWTTELDAHPVSRPTLPKAPATSADTTGHTVFRIILEEIATAESDGDEWERLEVLGLIDRFPVSERSELGRLLLNHLDRVTEAPAGTTSWQFRRIVQDNGVLQLGFGTCTNFTELHRDAFRAWAMLRHHELSEIRGIPAGVTPKTVAVLLTPRYDGPRPWDTTMVAVQGDLALTSEEIASFRAVWGEKSP